MTTVTVVYGTRPEAIKLAPLVHELELNSHFDVNLVSTGQHAEMLDQVEKIFCLRPSTNLRVMRKGQSLTALFRRVAEGMEAEFFAHKTDMLVVQGDTTSAMAAALVAYHWHIPVVHLEAGLRSGDFWSPFPEEMNRKVIGQLSCLHLAPTARSKANLLGSGIAAKDIVITGNTVVDAQHMVSSLAERGVLPNGLQDLQTTQANKRLILVTLHRRENQGKNIAPICSALSKIAREHPDSLIVFPVHRSPVVRVAVMRGFGDNNDVHVIEPENFPVGHRSSAEQALLATGFGVNDNIRLIEPVDYLTMLRLLKRSWAVVTDSGGLQEEAPTYGVPVLVMRDSTERAEGVDAGVAELIGTSASRLYERLTELWESHTIHDSFPAVMNPYGDGYAAKRAVAAIEEFFDIGHRIPDFGTMRLEEAQENVYFATPEKSENSILHSVSRYSVLH